jgi:hypothetical protein
MNNSISRKKLFFFSCEPGGAEVLSPVINFLRETTAYCISVGAYGLGAKRFRDNGIEYEEIIPVRRDDFSLFEKYSPDIVITSAASLPDRDMTEKNLWLNAEAKGISTFAFLDQWQNYGIRFSGVTESEFLKYQPTLINCINRIGKEDMLKVGFESTRLVTLGHPSLHALKFKNKVSAEELKIRIDIAPSSKISIFVSEPISEHYGKVRGYDQFDAFKIFLDLNKDKPDWHMVVKLHPKDKPDVFQEIVSKEEIKNILFIQNELNSFEVICLADKVFGMTSIMLIESFVLGKLAFSIQPNLQGEDLCILSRCGLIPIMGNNKDLKYFESVSQTLKSDFLLDFNYRDFLKILDEELSKS